LRLFPAREAQVRRRLSQQREFLRLVHRVGRRLLHIMHTAQAQQCGDVDQALVLDLHPRAGEIFHLCHGGSGSLAQGQEDLRHAVGEQGRRAAVAAARLRGSRRGSGSRRRGGARLQGDCRLGRRGDLSAAAGHQLTHLRAGQRAAQIAHRPASLKDHRRILADVVQQEHAISQFADQPRELRAVERLTGLRRRARQALEQAFLVPLGL